MAPKHSTEAQQTDPRELDYQSLASQGLIDSGLALHLEDFFTLERNLKLKEALKADITLRTNAAPLTRLEEERLYQLPDVFQLIIDEDTDMTDEDRLAKENKQLRAHIVAMQIQEEYLKKELEQTQHDLQNLQDKKDQAAAVELAQAKKEAEKILQQAKIEGDLILQQAHQERVAAENRYAKELQLLKGNLEFVAQQFSFLKENHAAMFSDYLQKINGAISEIDEKL